MLNNDVLYEIFKWCQDVDLYNLSLTMKLFNNIFHNEMLWKHKCTDLIVRSYYTQTNSYIQSYKKYKSLKNLNYYLNLYMPKDEILNLRTYRKNDLNHFNSVIKVPKSIDLLINLQHLDLSYNSMKDIPTAICNLINLKVLNLYKNKIKEIPKEINKLNNLEELSLGCNKIERINNACCLTNLRILDLRINKIDKIPSSIGNLINLNQLFIFNNDNIQSIPPEISNLVNLQIIAFNLRKFRSQIINYLPHVQLIYQ